MRPSRAQRSFARRLDAQLPLVASTLARSAHSGATLLQALDEAGDALPEPASSALAEVVAATRRGVPVDRALADWALRHRSDEVSVLVTAARVGHREGGDLAVALDAAAVTLLDRAEVRDEARALSAQARTSAAVLVALPPFGAACFCLLDPAVATTLFATPLGWACLLVGALLDGAGAWVMRRMVDGALR
jgi:tight adherence protein B